MNLEQARQHIGDAVIYRTAYGRVDQGVITSVNDRFVFVRYGSDWQSQATQPEALSLLTGETES